MLAEKTLRSALSPLRRDHADQPRRSRVGGAAAAEVGGIPHRLTSGRCRRAASRAGEAERAAALRELEEETGVTSVELLAEAPGWLSYDLPEELLGIALKGRYRGQRQKWFAMRFTGERRRSTSPRAAATRPSSTPGAGQTPRSCRT